MCQCSPYRFDKLSEKILRTIPVIHSSMVKNQITRILCNADPGYLFYEMFT